MLVDQVFMLNAFPKLILMQLKKLVDMIVFEQKGRHYRHFRNFLRDPLKNFNMSQLYQWISEH